METYARMGLVSKVFPDAELMRGTSAFARRVAEGAPLAAQLTKRVMRFGRDEDLAKAKEIVAANLPIVRTSENHMEAVNAFREKRPPQFNGRKGQEARIG